MKPVTRCSLHVLKAFALPDLSKRATRSLTPICIYAPYITPIITTNITKEYEKHTHETFTVALFLTNLKKLRSSEASKPKRQVNAFSIMSSPPCHLNTHKWVKVSARDAANLVKAERKNKLTCTFLRNILNFCLQKQRASLNYELWIMNGELF